VNRELKNKVFMFIVANKSRKVWTAKSLSKRLEINGISIACAMSELAKDKLVVIDTSRRIYRYSLSEEVFKN
jgi:Mn-dependent DtxR family transcriptional regulator